MILKKILAFRSGDLTNKENKEPFPVPLLRKRAHQIGPYEINTRTILDIKEFLKTRRESILKEQFYIKVGDAGYLVSKSKNKIIYKKMTEISKETQIWEFQTDKQKLILRTNDGKCFYSIHLTQKKKCTRFTISLPGQKYTINNHNRTALKIIPI